MNKPQFIDQKTITDRTLDLDTKDRNVIPQISIISTYLSKVLPKDLVRYS